MKNETLRLELDPVQVAESGILMCGTTTITDLKKDLARGHKIVQTEYIILGALLSIFRRNFAPKAHTRIVSCIKPVHVVEWDCTFVIRSATCCSILEVYL